VNRTVIKLAAALQPLAVSLGMAYAFMSCGGSDSPAPPPPPPAVGAKFESLPGHETMVAQASVEIEVGSSLKVAGVKFKAKKKWSGTITYISQKPADGYFDDNQLAPIAASLALGGQAHTGSQGGTPGQVGQTPKQDAVRLLPLPSDEEDDVYLWTSGRFTIGQLTQPQIDTINAGGEPIRFFFNFPWTTAAQLEAHIDTAFIQVFDENGVELPSSFYAQTKVVDAEPFWPTAPLMPGNSSHLTFVLEWLNLDDTPVRPEQLGLDQGARSFQIGLIALTLEEDYNFGYGAGLWEYYDEDDAKYGDGFWLGWHASNWIAPGSSSRHPLVTEVTDAVGTPVASASRGDVIQVVVDDGYDLPYVAVFVGEAQTVPLSVLNGPGPDQRTYVVQVPVEAELGSGFIWFKNHGATELWNPSQIGIQIPGFAAYGFEVL